jgi:hypothetical protein
MACGSEGARSCGVYTGPPTGLIPVQQPRAYYPSSHHYAPVTSQREAAIEMKPVPCKDKSDGRLKAVIQWFAFAIALLSPRSLTSMEGSYEIP